MESLQGYYSLIQYSEFPERIEYVNIGICLFSMSHPRVLVKFSDNPRKVAKMFNVDLGQHFELMKQSISSRILSEFSNDWSKTSIEKFVGMRSGKIRLSSSFSVLVSKPEETLERLFNSLVWEVPKVLRQERVGTKLRKAFQLGGVENLLVKPAVVVLPQGPIIKASYAYQNGGYNLICAISLKEDPNIAMQNAGKYALEGKWLYDSTSDATQKKLVIVGDLTDQREEFSAAIERVMDEHEVRFYRLASIEPLISDIRDNHSLHSS